MQPATHTHTFTARPTAQRLAWLGLDLGLVATGFAVVQAAKHAAGPLARGAGFALAPDLPLLIGATPALPRGQLAPTAVPLYNATHRVWAPPALLAACTFWIHSAALVAGRLAWLAHVTFDRGLGSGLRAPEGFQRG